MCCIRKAKVKNTIKLLQPQTINFDILYRHDYNGLLSDYLYKHFPICILEMDRCEFSILDNDNHNRIDPFVFHLASECVYIINDDDYALPTIQIIYRTKNVSKMFALVYNKGFHSHIIVN
jgi:hypothetical protein